MIVTRRLQGGTGTVNATLSLPGYKDGSGIVNCVEKFNGSSWSSAGSMIINGYYTAATGTQNAALSTGRYNGTGVIRCTESYNGSTWSSGGGLNVGRFSIGMAGTTTAGLAFFGNIPGATATCNESYNGTTWCNATGGINTRWRGWGGGTQNAAFMTGGTPNTTLERYNGMSWSSGPAMITGRQLLAAAGTCSSILAFGGYNTLSCTESFNGTSWSSATALPSGKWMGAGAGASNQSAIAFGGYQSPSKFYPNPAIFTAPAPAGVNICVL
jgi:hypothetical protein